ncbi:competence protein ComK [Solibacillus daqui]|uniref:competence protein ComK n=1 Tax=Solibacillus daqui TaxID=2912187 RepID=UPI00236657E8|nr:competence protein ComK [Solibacillus daqui]
MEKNKKYILTYATQVLFETVENGKQGIVVIENGESYFIEGSLNRIIAHNEMYYITNLEVAKRIAKEILGSSYGAPYIFMDMVWVPVEIYNRNVIIYVALHHIERISCLSNSKTLLQLTQCVNITLSISKNKLYSRLLVACLLKLLIDLKKKNIYKKGNTLSKPCEIIKEQGNVYYTKKDDLDNN